MKLIILILFFLLSESYEIIGSSGSISGDNQLDESSVDKPYLKSIKEFSQDLIEFFSEKLKKQIEMDLHSWLVMIK